MNENRKFVKCRRVQLSHQLYYLVWVGSERAMLLRRCQITRDNYIGFLQYRTHCTLLTVFFPLLCFILTSKRYSLSYPCSTDLINFINFPNGFSTARSSCAALRTSCDVHIHTFCAQPQRVIRSSLHWYLSYLGFFAVS